MRCDQCRYWMDEEQSTWESRLSGMHLCGGVRERWRITEDVTPWHERDEPDDESLELESWEADIGKALSDARAYVEDGSQYKAYLWTAPGFFCALFQEKEP